jgi:putative acetyltransferase
MITKASSKDFTAIIELWELSVRKTHDFLHEDYMLEIKSLLPSILPSVELYVNKNETGKITGFLGVANKKIEMLFIHPDFSGKGLGRMLTMFAIEKLHMNRVDVNEQNQQAVNFYKHLGFAVIARSDVDGLGKPYPLLMMEYKPR